jgi:purine-nucleoside phosphorylase
LYSNGKQEAKLATPHNSAEKGDIAKTVLMPGDPLRAKFIAETFLDNPKLFNEIRGMLGYTGTYKGKPVSVMAHGMGIASVGIYTYELYKFYDVENIIRIGSAGSYSKDLNVGDVAIASAAVSESTYAKVMLGEESDTAYPTKELYDKLVATAKKIGIKLVAGVGHSSDVFYVEDELGNDKPYWHAHAEDGKDFVEMESFGLFTNAKATGKNAACLVTISNSFVTDESTSAAERQHTFTNMMKIALETAAEL